MKFYIEYLNNNKFGNNCLENVINYVLQNHGKPNVEVGAFNTKLSTSVSEMQQTKINFNKTEGRQAAHIVVSFPKSSGLCLSEVCEIAPLIAEFFAARFQVVYNVHTNTSNLHIHIAFNTVSFVDGLKFNDTYSVRYAFKKHIENILAMLEEIYY